MPDAASEDPPHSGPSVRADGVIVSVTFPPRRECRYAGQEPG